MVVSAVPGIADMPDAGQAASFDKGERSGPYYSVERTSAWLGNYRRLPVCYDRSLTLYQGFFHIACFMKVLGRVLK